nr:MAG TPA: hypothetical protein [Caudoviricetes sp.]
MSPYYNYLFILSVIFLIISKAFYSYSIFIHP